MKQIISKALLAVCFLGGISCSDNEDFSDINDIYGKWNRVYNDPNLSVDGSIEYTFNKDKTFVVRSYDALAGKDTVVYGDTCVIGERLITLYTDKTEMPSLYLSGHPFNGQYEIVKLSSSELVLWETRDSYDPQTGEKKLLYFEKD